MGPYLNADTGVDCICKNGHMCKPSLTNAKKGGICKICVGLDEETSKKNFIMSITEKHKGKIIGKYINARTPIECICKNGHRCHPSPGHVQQGGGICLVCVGNDKGTAKKNFIMLVEKKHKGKVMGLYVNAKTLVECMCKNGHKCYPKPNYVQQGDGICSLCKNKTEGKVLSFLQTISSSIISQAIFPWCRNPKTNKLFKYDFYLPDLKLLLEVDGRQHYQQVSNWQAPEIQNERDLYKINQSILNGFTIIHMCQDEIWNDKINWEEQLRKELYLHPIPEFLIISQNETLHKILRPLVDIVFTDEEDLSE